jgi:hypothetical protein
MAVTGIVMNGNLIGLAHGRPQDCPIRRCPRQFRAERRVRRLNQCRCSRRTGLATVAPRCAALSAEPGSGRSVIEWTRRVGQPSGEAPCPVVHQAGGLKERMPRLTAARPTRTHPVPTAGSHRRDARIWRPRWRRQPPASRRRAFQLPACIGGTRTYVSGRRARTSLGHSWGTQWVNSGSRNVLSAAGVRWARG